MISIQHRTVILPIVNIAQLGTIVAVKVTQFMIKLTVEIESGTAMPSCCPFGTPVSFSVEALICHGDWFSSPNKIKARVALSPVSIKLFKR